jgi:hypothetical protein
LREVIKTKKPKVLEITEKTSNIAYVGIVDLPSRFNNKPVTKFSIEIIITIKRSLIDINKPNNIKI